MVVQLVRDYPELNGDLTQKWVGVTVRSEVCTNLKYEAVRAGIERATRQIWNPPIGVRFGACELPIAKVERNDDTASRSAALCVEHVRRERGQTRVGWPKPG